jgi:ABC-type transporter Mla maintaining outer membrane lipid asymmetry ATPase subunit MlaF
MLDPVVLLCDEPFSGLDPVSVKRIEELLVRINRQLHVTMIVVSHHVASALRLAEHLLLLLPDGAVAGTPGELRRSPDPRVAAFLGDDRDRADDPGTPHAAGPARCA